MDITNRTHLLSNTFFVVGWVGCSDKKRPQGVSVVLKNLDLELDHSKRTKCLSVDSVASLMVFDVPFSQLSILLEIPNDAKASETFLFLRADQSTTLPPSEASCGVMSVVLTRWAC